MDKVTAQKVVRTTFKAPFERKRFRDFINELCNGFDESKAQNMGVPDAFAPHVKSCQRLGTYTSPEGELADVLIVQLTESYKLERTRTALRDFVAHKLKRGESYKEAGLVAFVSGDTASWRFSYVRMEYATKRNPKTGKIVPEERLTPARRFSYLVGPDEQCHTAQSRFMALLQNTTDKPLLNAIEDSFSVETVTKEFFGEYARLFGETEAALSLVVRRDKGVRDDFKAKGVNVADFAKKLLGQIIFLYFIQKKGWMGVDKGAQWGDGPRNFMRLLADRAIANKQFLFNDVLEPLFYDTLASDRGKDAWCPTFQCRIPFLNGGLFEPLSGYDWEKTSIELPNSLFTNTEHSPIGDVGTGILDVFDRYNFTVNEAEPLEKDVAIDPEMLGKVFENLIEENRRKGLGAFYTPREVVHYMCQESLVNYLDAFMGKAGTSIERKDIEFLIHQGEQAAHYEAARIDGTSSYRRQLPVAIETHAADIDDALAAIRVCDPAIGSGAFPVGMMTEIVRSRSALTPYFTEASERTPYHFKRHAIQNSLYGVDVDGGAVEIAKLRLWLSLVVDEQNVREIQPLPNLDYRIVVGNSLLRLEVNLFNQKQFNQLEDLKPKYFNESNRKLKAQYKARIDELIQGLTNGQKLFDFEIYFSEVFHKGGGFDVVIANPPYGGQIDAERKLFSDLYPHTTKQFRDIYKIFIELGLSRLCANGGILCYITPNTLIRQARYKDVRRFLLNYTLLELVNLGEEVFEEVVVPTCFFFVKKAKAQDNLVTLRDVSEDSKFTGELLAAKGEQVAQTCFERTPDNAFSEEHEELGELQEHLEDVIEFRDAGINYQRVNVGMEAKGKSDLGQRLLYEGKKESSGDVEYWKGEDINKYFIAQSTGRFVRMKTKSSLRSNERVVLNRQFF